ncbi:MAG TPA: AraC family transcriptional regulator [Chryseosolibacter sp.]|jgi:AraC-type DNA-binding domain-containing proteins
MFNIQDLIKDSQLFRKFEVDDLLFVEIICPVEEDKAASDIWWHDNFFSYAIGGEMVLKTLRGEYVFKAGDCIFAKKGSIISGRHRFREDFCELRIFVPDSFIKAVFQKHQIPVECIGRDDTDSLIPLPPNEILQVYFQSLLTYFRQPSPPPGSLLRLRFEELLVNLTCNDIYKPLTNFFYQVCTSSRISIREVMETNFFLNISLEEFARLCGRSVSAFKAEFKNIFHTTPGKWLLEKRLEYSRYLLETSRMCIDEICTVSGFENRSHFNRTFKNKYHETAGRIQQRKFSYNNPSTSF